MTVGVPTQRSGLSTCCVYSQWPLAAGFAKLVQDAMKFGWRHESVQIPAALCTVVVGVASLGAFCRDHASCQKVSTATPIDL